MRRARVVDEIPAVRTADMVGIRGLRVHVCGGLGFGGIVEGATTNGSALARGSADVSLWQLGTHIHTG